VTLQLVRSTLPGSTPDEPLPRGSITPRLWTRPLRKLTPETSYGYRVIWFAAVILGEPLDAWQQWLVIHLGELLPDGRPRFRRLLVIVGRQNGKTHLCKVLALYWLFVESQRLVFGSSTKLDYAAESWQAALDTARATPALAERMRRPRLGKGEQTMITADGCRYKIGTANKKGGRSLSIKRMIGDELREQVTWDAYNAAYRAMNAQPDGQAVWISNQGDATAVVLNGLRDDALDYIGSGRGDERLGLFEWSAPEGTHPTDVAGWAMANPQLGRGRMDYDTIRGDAVNLAKPGADPIALAQFLTEVLCIAVTRTRPALDVAGWGRGKLPAPLDAYRGRLAACVDIAPDLQHATFAVAAALEDGRTRVEIVAAWTGADAVEQLRRALPALVAEVKPRKLGWFPAGPAATLDADLRDRRKAGVRGWPPRGVVMAEITSDAAAVCMGFGEQVAGGRVLHSGQELLDAQVDRAEKLMIRERWVFTRRGSGHVDAVYAAAGAVHLARTVPARRPRTRMSVAPS
jgi:hypothetical protein